MKKLFVTIMACLAVTCVMAVSLHSNTEDSKAMIRLRTICVVVGSVVMRHLGMT